MLSSALFWSQQELGYAVAWAPALQTRDAIMSRVVKASQKSAMNSCVMRWPSNAARFTDEPPRCICLSCWSCVLNTHSFRTPSLISLVRRLAFLAFLFAWALQLLTPSTT